jgi:hypothetical protein
VKNIQAKLISEINEMLNEYSVCDKERYMTDEIAINKTKEPIFKLLLAKIINEEGQYEERDLVNSLAYFMDLSPMTVDRYLAKVCSSVGIYDKVKNHGGVFVQYKK